MLRGSALRDAALKIFSPLDPDQIGDVSIDVTLDNMFWIPKIQPITASINLSNIPPEHEMFDSVKVTRGAFLLMPGQYIKARLSEYSHMTGDLVGLFTLRSAIAQAGLDQVTSLIMRPSWQGQLVLELINAYPIPLELEPGLKIGQVSLLPVQEVYP